MSKIPYGVVSDIHLHNWSAFHSVLATGENDRLMIILEELQDAAKVMVQSGCRRMYITGDLFHVRGKMTPSVLNPTLKMFKSLIRIIEIRIIPGNHDLESDDSRELTNATQALEALGCVVVTEETYFEDDDVLMIPWESNLGKLKDKMAHCQIEYEPETVMIHAPLNGVIPGIPDHGLDAKDLESMGFNLVFCGHYHDHVDFKNGIFSVGALTHQTWGDVNTQAGYLIVGEDRKVEHITSGAPQFVDYDETMSDKDVKDRCAGNYVRVKLGEASEKEIAVIRELVKSEYDAKAVIVYAQPQRTKSERGATVEAGASMETSVHEYVKNSDTEVDKDMLDRECAAIMAESDNGEDD
jgi:DNA repair exonuclease SbcCD nuclease subunit